MMVFRNANTITEDNRRRSGLPIALLGMEYDNNITEEYKAITIALNITNNYPTNDDY